VAGLTAQSEILSRGFNGRLDPIATAPRETGRPLLLYPRPRTVFEQRSDGPLLDLTNPAVRRMIKLAKKRSYITYGDLDQVMPPEEFTPE
jgi:hypothetical protein